MSNSEKINHLFEQVYAHLPQEGEAALTHEQYEALKQAFASLNWKRHLIDIRVSVPFPFCRFYVVFLAGRERRSRKRLQAERVRYPVWTSGNIVMIAASLSVLTLSLLGLLQIRLPALNSSEASKPYPTAIPWIQNETRCTDSGRIWREEKCWDFEHNPFF